MDLDDGGVDYAVLHVGLVRAGFEKPLEKIGFDPVAAPLEDGVLVAEDPRRVAPRAAGAVRKCPSEKVLSRRN